MPRHYEQRKLKPVKKRRRSDSLHKLFSLPVADTTVINPPAEIDSMIKLASSTICWARDTFPVALDKARAAGFDAVEGMFFPREVYPFHGDLREIPPAELRRQLAERGLTLAAVHIAAIMTPTEQKRRALTDYCLRAIEVAAELGCRTVVDGGPDRASEPFQPFLRSLEEIVPRLEGLLRERFQVEVFPHSLNVSRPGSDLRVQVQTDPRYAAFVDRAVGREVLGVRMRSSTACCDRFPDVFRSAPYPAGRHPRVFRSIFRPPGCVVPPVRWRSGPLVSPPRGSSRRGGESLPTTAVGRTSGTGSVVTAAGLARRAPAPG